MTSAYLTVGHLPHTQKYSSYTPKSRVNDADRYCIKYKNLFVIIWN